MRLLPKIIKSADSSRNVQEYTFQSDFTADDVRSEPEMPREYAEASEVFEGALRQAEELLNKAREESEQIREDAKAEGYRQGYEAGLEEGHQQAYNDYKIKLDYEMNRFLQETKDVIESVTRAKEEILDKYMDDLKKITLMIAEKIIQTSLKTSSEVVKRMILAATNKLKKSQWAKIYITRSSVGTAVQADVELLRELRHLSDNIKIIAMESEEEGTCIIELPDEVIDASVSTQLENIRDILNNARA